MPFQDVNSAYYDGEVAIQGVGCYFRLLECPFKTRCVMPFLGVEVPFKDVAVSSEDVRVPFKNVGVPFNDKGVTFQGVECPFMV